MACQAVYVCVSLGNMWVCVCVSVCARESAPVYQCHLCCVCLVCPWVSTSVCWYMAHEDPQPRGDQAGWIQCISPVVVSALVTGAEAFCGLKTESPGSALRVLGSLHPTHSRLVFGGERDTWGQALYR